MSTSNDVAIEAWNTVLFDKFTRFEHLLTRGLGSVSDAFFACQPYADGAQVLDIGCGFGDTTRQLAAMVGVDGRVIGVDCAGNFIQRCRHDSAGLKNVDYFVADVQNEDLRGPYDHAFSRFGTMFFNSPGAAMRNVRRALKPGGELTMLVWRRREDQPWLYEAERLVRSMVLVVPHEDTDQVHCGPGPFSMCGADLVSDLLRSAGFDRIRLERHDTVICIGHDLDEAVEFAMTLGPAGEILRLAGEEGERLKPEVRIALHQTLAAHEQSDGRICAQASVWIVQARNPD